VLVDDADRVIGNSAVVLGIQPPEGPLARVLGENAGDAPPFLRERVLRRSPIPRFGGKLKFGADAGPDLEAAPDWLTFYRIYFVVDANLP